MKHISQRYRLQCYEEKGNDKSKNNMIIHGDNRIVLDLLAEQGYANEIKCIYIDPPYNNGEVYHHYNDDRCHEEWLNEMTDVLYKLKALMSEDGSIWISIDDSEVHYLKVAADKVFGRNNFVNTIIWEHRTTRENRNIFSNNHEYILVYCKNTQKFKEARNLLPIDAKVLSRYKNPDNDPRGMWQSVSLNVQDGHAVPSQFYDIVAPNGKVHKLPNGRCWGYNEDRMKQEIANNNIWFGKDGNGVPRQKQFLSERKGGLTPETLWKADDVKTTKTAKKQIIELFPDEKVFDTPKPEELIKRILEIATNEGDIVLDAYLGSGTTAAVAHKMNRYYIGIEQGNQIVDLVIPRLNKVIDGEVQGITKEVKWQGGGGYKYLKVEERQ